MIAGRRPSRSLSAPPKVLAEDFTTCSAAHSSGTMGSVTPACCARSSRKASDELPSVKTATTTR